MAPAKGTGYTPTEFQLAKYQLSGGVDSKVHGLVLPPPKLQVCQNAYSDRTGSLSRRFGRSLLSSNIQGGGTMADPVALGTYKGDLLAWTGFASSASGAAYEYSETETHWVSKGSVESPRVRTLNVARDDASVGISQGDSATANGITVHAFEEGTAVRMTITDANGVILKRAYTLFSGGTSRNVRCVARGNLIYVFWYDSTLGATGSIRVAIIDATSSSSLGVMQPTPVTVTGAISAVWPLWDVVANSSFGIFIAWNDTTALRLSFGFVDATGVLGSTSTSAMVADPGAGGFITCAVAPGNAMHGIVYAVGTAPNDVYALHRSWSGAAWTATATSGAIAAGISLIVANVACRYTSATTLRIVYTDGVTAAPVVYQSTYTTAGVTAAVGTLRNSWLMSKPVLAADLNLYFWVMAYSGRSALVERVMFLMRQDGVVIAQALDVPGTILVTNAPLMLPQIEASGNSLSASLVYLDGTIAAAAPTSALALRRTTVDMTHSDSHAVVEAAQTLLMAGGFLQQFDGDSFVEAAFLLPFDTFDVADPTPSTVAGTNLTPLAIYAYHFIYAWTNIRGERMLGTNYGAKTCPALTGTNNKLTFALPTLTHTRIQSAQSRGDVVILAYRSDPNPTADSQHRLVGVIKNDPTANTVTFADTVPDTTEATSEQFYQDGGELENTAPPAGHLVASGNGRVYVAGMADLPTTVIASKTRVDGRVVEFSDFLPRIVIPDGSGPITAIAMLNESLIVFTETRIYRVNGDGPNNQGFGAFNTPLLITSDDGTTSPRSVVVTGDGVMFEGVSGSKMLLDQSFQVTYIGAPLEKLADAGACTGTCVIPALQQVRFSYASTTHVYDYFHKQWYVFTHGSEGPTCVWNNVHAAIDTGVVYDDETVWTDAGDPYTMELKLGWLTSGASIMSNLRVRSLGLIGQSLAAHNLAINVGYDQAAATELLETAIAGAGPLAPQWRLSQQRCYAIEVTIRDAKLDVYLADVVQNTAGMRLNELAFEVGLVNPRLSRYDGTAPGGGNDGPIGV
jgi:hypothetical protein